MSVSMEFENSLHPRTWRGNCVFGWEQVRVVSKQLGALTSLTHRERPATAMDKGQHVRDSTGADTLTDGQKGQNALPWESGTLPRFATR